MKWTKWADALRCFAIEAGDGGGGAEEGVHGCFGGRRGVHRGLWGMSERG